MSSPPRPDPSDLSSNLADFSLTSHRPRPPNTQRISLGAAGLLQDEDMSLAMGGDDLDDSFGLFNHPQSLDDTEEGEDTERLDRDGEKTVKMSHGAKGSSGGGFEFGGSMAASTNTQPFSLSSSTLTRQAQSQTTPRRRSEDEGEAEEEQEEEEEDELLIEGFSSFSEEDQKRIRELRAERDELRGMNKILEQVVGALKVTEGNMTHLAAASATSHDLLDLYSRICIQAEHTKDLLLDPDYNGIQADEDFMRTRERALVEEQERLRIESIERERLAEEEERRRVEREERNREDLERRKAAGGTRGGVTRGRGVVRGSTTRGGIRPTVSASTRGGAGNASISSNGSGIPVAGGGRGSASVSGVRGVRGLRSRGGVSGIGRGRGTT